MTRCIVLENTYLDTFFRKTARKKSMLLQKHENNVNELLVKFEDDNRYSLLLK